jgi:hypothetical protein
VRERSLARPRAHATAADRAPRDTKGSIERLCTDEKRLEDAWVEAQRVTPLQPVTNTIGLYASISKINWDFDATVVRGIMVDAAKKTARHFEFDAGQSQFDVTNSLWDMM